MTLTAPSRSSTVMTAYRSPFLVFLRVDRGDQPGDRDHRLVLAALVGHQLADRHVAGLGQHVLEPGERVVGDVEPEHVALEGEQRALVPLVERRDPDRDRREVLVEPAEQRVLADRLVALEVEVLVDGVLVDGDQARAGRTRGSRTRRPCTATRAPACCRP